MLISFSYKQITKLIEALEFKWKHDKAKRPGFPFSVKGRGQYEYKYGIGDTLMEELISKLKAYKDDMLLGE